MMATALTICACTLAIFGGYLLAARREDERCRKAVASCEEATYARDHWKSYALALEVLCECCAEGDRSGAENARRTIRRERNLLRLLREYDD